MKKIEFTHTYINAVRGTVRCVKSKDIAFLQPPNNEEVTVLNEYGAKLKLMKVDLKKISK